VRPDLVRFPREVELALFRIAQEALTNIHLHSGSPTADITLSRDAHRVNLQVADHGRGIPPACLELGSNVRSIVGVGIAGMRERMRQLGGRLEIESGDDGTCIKATLPIAGANPFLRARPQSWRY
jgi:signal transduction histidine kinase